MAFFRNNGGTWAPPKALHRNSGGSWVPAKALWRNVGGVWTQVWSARTVSVRLSSFTQVRAAGLGSRYYDRAVFAVTVSDGATPSSYLWSGDVFGTGSTAIFTGPIYDTNAWTYQVTGTAYVSVVVGGSTYTASLPFQYTAGDLN